jgi:high-affinity nickel permease
MNSAPIIGFAFGLRHGADPDHLTAIDGLSRIFIILMGFRIWARSGHGQLVAAATAEPRDAFKIITA